MPFDTTPQTGPEVVLIDTRHSFDAGLLGYAGHADPHEDGQGLIVERDEKGRVSLFGPDGEVHLDAVEVRELIKSLLGAVKFALIEGVAQ